MATTKLPLREASPMVIKRPPKLASVWVESTPDTAKPATDVAPDTVRPAFAVTRPDAVRAAVDVAPDTVKFLATVAFPLIAVFPATDASDWAVS